MKCPHCKKNQDTVVDTRSVKAGKIIRRRRQCACGERFTTYEIIHGTNLEDLGLIEKTVKIRAFRPDRINFKPKSILTTKEGQMKARLARTVKNAC